MINVQNIAYEREKRQNSARYIEKGKTIHKDDKRATNDFRAILRETHFMRTGQKHERDKRNEV